MHSSKKLFKAPACPNPIVGFKCKIIILYYSSVKVNMQKNSAETVP